jgi:hypothetical protein
MRSACALCGEEAFTPKAAELGMVTPWRTHAHGSYVLGRLALEYREAKATLAAID